MKNKLILFAAMATVGVLFAVYMVPKIAARNNLDALETVLAEFKQDLPEDAVVWFIAKDTAPGPPEIYYKTQFALAPRVVIMPGSIEDVPAGGNVFVVDDQSKSGSKRDVSKLIAGGTFSVSREGFTVTRFTKQ